MQIYSKFFVTWGVYKLFLGVFSQYVRKPPCNAGVSIKSIICSGSIYSTLLWSETTYDPWLRFNSHIKNIIRESRCLKFIYLTYHWWVSKNLIISEIKMMMDFEQINFSLYFVIFRINQWMRRDLVSKSQKEHYRSTIIPNSPTFATNVSLFILVNFDKRKYEVVW